MNRTFLLLVTFLFWFSLPSCAQQNLFNLPSSDITIKSKPFFQQQINIVSDGTVLLNSTFSYGLGNELEIGFNVLGIVIEREHGFVSNSDGANPPTYPFYTLNVQKAWTLNKSFKLAVGTQTGYSVGMHFGTYDYFNVVTALPQYHLKVITGANYGSQSFLGTGDKDPSLPATYSPIGFQVGLEYELIKEKLLAQGEYLSGTHSLGLTAVGFGYHVSEHWVMSLGYQIPNASNNALNSVIVEFTYVPSVVSHRRVYHEGHPD